MMRLCYFPVNCAWGFVFGDDLRTAQVIPMGDWGRLFSLRAFAVHAAERQRLRVARDGTVTPA